jgi:hypothetical protein
MTGNPDPSFAKASVLARRFRALFLERLGTLSFTEEFTNRYELAITAPHP